jgi:hypothetical protein
VAETVALEPSTAIGAARTTVLAPFTVIGTAGTALMGGGRKGVWGKPGTGAVIFRGWGRFRVSPSAIPDWFHSFSLCGVELE